MSAHKAITGRMTLMAQYNYPCNSLPRCVWTTATSQVLGLHVPDKTTVAAAWFAFHAPFQVLDKPAHTDRWVRPTPTPFHASWVSASASQTAPRHEGDQRRRPSPERHLLLHPNQPTTCSPGRGRPRTGLLLEVSVSAVRGFASPASGRGTVPLPHLLPPIVSSTFSEYSDFRLSAVCWARGPDNDILPPLQIKHLPQRAIFSPHRGLVTGRRGSSSMTTAAYKYDPTF
jgi:hypothetical protein